MPKHFRPNFVKDVKSVQKDINSRFYENGRYSPTREQGTHHFHKLIAEFMNREF